MNNQAGAAFSQFFDSVRAEMKARRERRESDAIKRTMASGERINELSATVKRAVATKTFIQSDFWNEYLLPFLRSESVLKPASVKDIEPSPYDRAWMTYLIGSGKVIILTKLISTLDDWQAQGEEAERVLNIEAEKRRRVGA